MNANFVCLIWCSQFPWHLVLELDKEAFPPRWPNSPGKIGLNKALLFFIKLNKTAVHLVPVLELCYRILGPFQTFTHKHKPLVMPLSIISQKLLENLDYL